MHELSNVGGKGCDPSRKVLAPKGKHSYQRFGSLPIFDMFDYQQKVEDGILRNYLDDKQERFQNNRY